MANEYYERLSEMNPGDLADGLAMEAEFDAISQGFSKLPTPHTGGQGFDGPVRVGDAVNDDEAVNLGQLQAAIGEAVLLPIATYGNLNAAAWATLPSNTYLLFGTGAQLSNTPYTLVAGATYYLQVRHVIGGAGVSTYHDQLSLASEGDASNIDLRRLFVRTGSSLANASAGGWVGVAMNKAALTALESLVPAVDKIAYYTGLGAALTSLTPFARSLLGDISASAARGTLQVPGLYSGNEVGMDIDTLLSPGVHRLGPSPENGPPGASYCQVDVIYAAADTITQTIALYSTGELWVRTGFYANGAWVFTVWRKQYDSKNILGAVSQSGGVPTGAIIQSGSNANGSFVRYADGTQICYQIVISATPVNTPVGSIFTTGSNEWTFPSSFLVTPSVIISEAGGVGLCWGGLGTAATNSGGTSWGLFSSRASNVPIGALMAIGRWY